jgi:hypothetical protein
MVAMLSGLVVAGLGAGVASAQSPQTTPYEAADPAEQEQKTTTTTTTTTDVDSTTETTPATPQVQVTPPAPVVVEQPAPVVEQPAPVIVEDNPVNVNIIEPKARRNMSLSLGGGVSNFTDETLQSRTGMSGAYEARLGIGMSSIIGIEAAYVGTAASIDTLGLDDEALLISNGVEGLARVNLGTFDVQPYIVGGASWVRYNVVNDSFNTSDVQDSDDVLAIPFGGGLSTYLGDSGLMVDARFTFRKMIDDELVRATPTNSDGASLDNWLATLRLGYTF